MLFIIEYKIDFLLNIFRNYVFVLLVNYLDMGDVIWKEIVEEIWNVLLMFVVKFLKVILYIVKYNYMYCIYFLNFF